MKWRRIDHLSENEKLSVSCVMWTKKSNMRRVVFPRQHHLVRGWKYSNKIGLIRSFPNMSLFSVDSLQLTRFSYFFSWNAPWSNVLTMTTNGIVGVHTYIYIYIHICMDLFQRPCEGLWYLHSRSTQFGGAPEMLIQRPDFRLAARPTEDRSNWEKISLQVTRYG